MNKASTTDRPPTGRRRLNKTLINTLMAILNSPDFSLLLFIFSVPVLQMASAHQFSLGCPLIEFLVSFF